MIPTEDQECVAFVEYLELKRLKFTHIPNETYTTSWNVKMRNKKLGVRRGFPDYVVLVAEGILFVEMKRKKGGILKPHQKEWIDELQKRNGVEARVCKGAEEAIAFVEEFM